MPSTVEEIRETLAKRCKKETIADDTALKDLGLDSLDVVEMCLDFEDKYGITFETAELGELKTVSDLLAKIDAKLAGKN